MPAGRPKGTGRWTPARIAQLWEDADLNAGTDGDVNKKDVAGGVKEQGPGKYRDNTVEQIRQQLSKRYLQKKKTENVDAFIDRVNPFNEHMWAHLLGEK